MHYPYALYLDSKIIGTARQLVSFFEQGVFSAQQTIIYIKRYKESANQYMEIFERAGISYRFMKPKELDELENQVIFYAFNAQSNCRFVANRKLKHIFITHGESNKVASVKPIIRIYDHVVMAGKLSLERFYKSRLFDEHDYETGRLILMGDTFIGQTGFNREQKGEPVLFYAPTWEGGLASENYSSLQNIDLVYVAILQLAKKLQLKTIVVQPHPNIGHREKEYIKTLTSLLRLLSHSGFKVCLQHNNVALSWRDKYRLSRGGIEIIHRLDCFYAKHALVDISAMESMCLNEDINYNIFLYQNLLRTDLATKYLELYQDIGIFLDMNEDLDCHQTLKLRNNLDIKNDLISFSVEHISNLEKSSRVETLVNYIGRV